MPEYRIPEIENLPAPKDATRRRIVFVTSGSARSLEYMGPMQVFDEARIFCQLGRQPLDDQCLFETVRPEGLRLEDLGHAACGKTFEKLIAPELSVFRGRLIHRTYATTVFSPKARRPFRMPSPHR